MDACRSQRIAHWNAVYTAKAEADVSWFQASPQPSLGLITQLAQPDAAVIDIGGGASRLVDALLARGFPEPTVLDISQAAIDVAKTRLGRSAALARWIAADVTEWAVAGRYDIWHDRAAFHFLTGAAERAAYLARLDQALQPQGHAIIATFAADGPERCSGLPVCRYDPADLQAALGPGLTLIGAHRHQHLTPWGAPQAFWFSQFRKN